MTDTLAKLFGSAARVKLLRLFLFNPSATYTAAEAAARARVPTPEARRELEGFKKIGLLTRAVRARTARFGLNPDFEYTEPLQNLLLNASAHAANMYKRIRHTGAIKLVVVAGVFVGEWEGKIDLFVVGDRIKDDKLRRAIRLLESEVGRDLRFALLTTQEFFYRLNMNDHLVRDVLDYPHRIVFDRLDIGLE